MEQINYELLMLVAMVFFVIGSKYGKFINDNHWKNEIDKIKWDTIPKSMTDAIRMEKLSDIKNTPVYVITINAIAEIFDNENKEV